MDNLKMYPATTKRSENFKSKIPVPIFKVNSSIRSEERKEISKTISSKPETSINKSTKNCPPLPKENYKTQFVKPTLSKKIYKRNEVCKSQSASTEFSNKTFAKNYIVSRNFKEKSLPFKENKPFNKTNKDISTEFFKKVTEKNLVKKETKKAKLLADQKYESYNASSPTSNDRDIQIENKHKQNKKLYASENMLEKRNQEKVMSRDFSAQKGIKFESNEIFRQMILRDRGLSPSACKLAPGVKLSSVVTHRPSAYDQVFEVHPDPHKYAVEAIEKMSARSSCIKLSTQFEKMGSSPQIRNSFYTPGVNPEEKVMKSLAIIKAKRIQQSALKSEKKKVTFNSNVEEFSAKIDFSLEQKSFANPEDKLTEISEGSFENTSPSPVRNHSSTNGEVEEKCFNASKLESLNECGKSPEQGNHHEHTISSQCNEDSEINILVEKCQNVLKPHETNDLLVTDCNKASLCCSKKISSASVYRSNNFKFMNEAFSCQKTTSGILPKCLHHSKLRSTKMKICTPQPVSFASNSRLLHDCSPDFLKERNLVNLSNMAPIYTPLVLKNIAKRSAESPENLSPVKLKLDFEATENETPKKEKKIQVSSIKNIATTTKKLDNLADKECDNFLSNEKCAVLCGRYLQNPVALTLTEGDEMHFVPIRL